jgi:nucleotide-binding universal stress UspA family protein
MIQNVKKILAPIDFSEPSMAAMRGAMELAKDIGAEVHLVHVVVPHRSFIPLPLATNAEQSRELVREAAMVEQAEEELARFKKDEFGDSKKVFTYTVVGPPVQKLVDYATQNQIDLILMSTKGRTGGEHMLLGSVTERLVRTAPCSVLVFRRKPQAS